MGFMKTKKLKIVLAEDHVIVRAGLKALLEFEPDFLVVGEADNGIDAIKLVAKVLPDLVIMDIAMPKLNGIEASRQILAKNPNVKILILSAHSDDGYIEKIRQLGVKGYLVKQCSPHLLVEAVRAIAAGQKVFSPEIETRMDFLKRSKRFSSERGFGGNIDLSARESEVLQLVAEGHSNKMVAFELGISIKTVEKHRQSLMNKLAIHDTAGLTRHAISQGIIRSDLSAVSN
jgi:DNA-binding NarL/FixJ family response regulator